MKGGQKILVKSFSINNVKTGLTIRLIFAKLATLR